jgi:hypothetical protein
VVAGVGSSDQGDTAPSGLALGPQISGDTPLPLSVTQIEMYGPGPRPCCLAVLSSSQTFAVSMLSRPPPGSVASRALMQRLRSDFSSCEAPTPTCQSPSTPPP